MIFEDESANTYNNNNINNNLSSNTLNSRAIPTEQEQQIIKSWTKNNIETIIHFHHKVKQRKNIFEKLHQHRINKTLPYELKNKLHINYQPSTTLESSTEEKSLHAQNEIM